jgi:tetratricopeptide (TPR) repeat protein
MPSFPCRLRRDVARRASVRGLPDILAPQSGRSDRLEVRTDMPTTNSQATGEPDRHEPSAAYEAALEDYGKAVEALRSGDYGRARELFDRARDVATHEPELADRAAVWSRICERRLTEPAEEPATPESRLRRAIFLMNAGAVDDALHLLNRLQADSPMDPDVLYVRACGWALKGAVEKAVGDLRQAIAVDPKVRFQAANDPDFERIREEPAFIDIIEPTPPGA